jgi:hypothetical protein
MVPRGLSHFMPFAASISAAPSVLPPVFFTDCGFGDGTGNSPTSSS